MRILPRPCAGTRSDGTPERVVRDEPALKPQKMGSPEVRPVAGAKAGAAAPKTPRRGRYATRCRARARAASRVPSATLATPATKVPARGGTHSPVEGGHAGPPFPFQDPLDLYILEAVSVGNFPKLLAYLLALYALPASYVHSIAIRVRTRQFGPPAPHAVLAHLDRYVEWSRDHKKCVTYFRGVPAGWATGFSSTDVQSLAVGTPESIGRVALKGLNPYVWVTALTVALGKGITSDDAACLDLLLACHLSGPACAHLVQGAWYRTNIPNYNPWVLMSVLSLAAWTNSIGVLLPAGTSAALSDKVPGAADIWHLSEAEGAPRFQPPDSVLFRVIGGRLVPEHVFWVLKTGGLALFQVLHRAMVPVANPVYQAALVFAGLVKSTPDVLAKLEYPTERYPVGVPRVFTDFTSEDWDTIVAHTPPGPFPCVPAAPSSEHAGAGTGTGVGTCTERTEA